MNCEVLVCKLHGSDWQECIDAALPECENLIECGELATVTISPTNPVLVSMMNNIPKVALCAEHARVNRDKAGNPPNGSGSEVTRHLSRNSVPQTITAPVFQSVADFLSAYSDKKKTIDELTNKFVDKARQTKQAQDDVIPHLAFMQSLLSKKGANHHLVIAARKQGHKIPWWTDYYESYKDKLWESLRTMERRIAAYRDDPTAPVSKPDRDPIPHLTKTDRKTLIEGNQRAVELVAALEAGRDGKKEIADFKAVMSAKRLDNIVQAHEQEPDYKNIPSKVFHGEVGLADKYLPKLEAIFCKDQVKIEDCHEGKFGYRTVRYNRAKVTFLIDLPDLDRFIAKQDELYAVAKPVTQEKL